jgi:hypothetical protein
VLWAAGALLGIAVTAALTWSVSQLSSQRIGLSSQPLSVIRGLAPPPAEDQSAGSVNRRARSPEVPVAPPPSTTSTAPHLSVPGNRPPAPAASPSHGGQSRAGSATTSAGSLPSPGGDHADDTGQSGPSASSSASDGSGRDD